MSTSGAALISYTAIIEPHWLEIVRRDLSITNLPAGLEGMTLAQVSDLHACSYVDEEYLTRSLDRLKALAPDMVAFTGDFITWEHDRSDGVKLAQLRRVLSHFPQGRLGTVGILGNHDYGETWKDTNIASRIAAVATAAGIQVIRNEVAPIAGLDIIGIDDLWSGRASPRLAIERRGNPAAIALCHNPDALDELPWDGFDGWVLAGHTHGGQCKPPFLPPPVLPVKNRRYTSGEVKVDQHRTLYISRGVGHLFQVRFNVRPEITLFTLRRA